VDGGSQIGIPRAQIASFLPPEEASSVLHKLDSNAEDLVSLAQWTDGLRRCIDDHRMRMHDDGHQWLQDLLRAFNCIVDSARLQHELRWSALLREAEAVYHLVLEQAQDSGQAVVSTSYRVGIRLIRMRLRACVLVVLASVYVNRSAPGGRSSSLNCSSSSIV